MFPFWYEDRIAPFDKERMRKRIRRLPLYEQALALERLPEDALASFEQNCLKIERCSYEAYQSVLKRSFRPASLMITFTHVLFGLIAALSLHVLVMVSGLSPEYLFMRPFLFFGGSLMVFMGWRALLKTNHLGVELTNDTFEIVEARFYNLGLEAGRLKALIEHSQDDKCNETQQ